MTQHVNFNISLHNKPIKIVLNNFDSCRKKYMELVTVFRSRYFLSFFFFFFFFFFFLFFFFLDYSLNHVSIRESLVLRGPQGRLVLPTESPSKNKVIT